MSVSRTTSRTAWPAGVAVGEGVRAALAGRWVSATLVLLSCWAVAAPGAFDAVAVARLAEEERRFLAAGGNVMLVENREAGVPAYACDQAARSPGVLASAALTRQEPAVLTAAPGGDVGVSSATAGIYGLLGVAADRPTGAIVPVTLAERMGLRDGDWIVLRPAPGTRGTSLPSDAVRIAVVDTSVLGEAHGGIILPTTAAPGDTADACVVMARPADLAVVKSALPAMLPAGTGQTVVLDRLITGEFAADYSGQYRERPLQWAWAAAGAVVGLVWLLVGWVRRSADALYAAMGADLATRLQVRLAEWGLLAGVGATWGTALGIIFAVAMGAPFGIAANYVTRHALASMLMASAIVLIGQLRRPRSLLADLKDR